MTGWDLVSTLRCVPGIRHACDLDLLLFFHRHPRAILTAERLVSYLGYEREQVGRSLDGLIEAGLLLRSPNPAHSARLYILDLSGESGGHLESLLELAATREGRHELKALLSGQPDAGPQASRPRGPRLAKVG